MLRITKNIAEANLVTHSSTFHPDDVFSTMFMAMIVDDPVVARVSSVDGARSDAIIYDIGFGKYDHHGVDAKMRNEKIKFCSFGLLWHDFGLSYLEKMMNQDDAYKLFKVIDEKLIMQIDGIDNGIFPKVEALYSLMDLDKVIDSFNKAWNEEVDNDDNFMQAVDVARLIFERMIVREKAKIDASKIIEEKIAKMEGSILILDEYMPYQEAVFSSNLEKAKDILVVIFPSNRGGYSIKPMTKSKDSKELVCNFPKEWWGLHDEELAKISEIKGAKFVHLNGFLATALTLDDAILMANKAMENKE